LNSDILVLLLSIPLFGIFCFYSYKTEGKLGVWEMFFIAISAVLITAFCFFVYVGISVWLSD